MKNFTRSGGSLVATLLLGAALTLPITAVAGDEPTQGLKPGDVAPAFSLVGSDGQTHNLADFKGKKPVVLAWFPKAFTSG